eukprot:GFUD01002989.1.p1 GENE.GFUD01002989.1~~GFUD01002989.1.p1  ORF type:complete len:276 (+),score=56.75 GFUD01002989.1:83-910(+)
MGWGCMVVTLVAATASTTNSFNLEISDDQFSVKKGEQFFLSCQADSAYEFCKFRSPTGQFCDFEWKRNIWNVTRAECAGLEDRVTFAGSYDDHECALLVDGAEESDQGLWSCEVESYVLGGGRGSGWLRIGEFNVNILIPTTTTTTTTSTPSPTSSFNRSSRNLELDYASYDIDTLQSTTKLDLSSANVLPLALSLVLIVIIISIIAILVLVHKMKNGSVDKVITLEAGDLNTSFEEPTEPKEPKGDKIMEEVLFMRKVFPHIINFPNDEPGLNL